MKNGLLIVGRFLIGATVAYGVNKMLDEKTNELIEDGGVVNAATIGAAQGLISVATGALVAAVIL